MPLAGVTVVKVREQEAQEISGPDQTCKHLINTEASSGCVNAQVILIPSRMTFHSFKGEQVHNQPKVWTHPSDSMCFLSF